MLKKHELSDPDSCLNRADDDEPIFVLRANDEAAASIVRKWADKYAYIKSGRYENDLTEEQMAKLTEARELAKRMVEWRRARVGRKNARKQTSEEI